LLVDMNMSVSIGRRTLKTLCSQACQVQNLI
jgi:hypothetical protein